MHALFAVIMATILLPYIVAVLFWLEHSAIRRWGARIAAIVAMWCTVTWAAIFYFDGGLPVDDNLWFIGKIFCAVICGLIATGMSFSGQKGG